MSALQRQCVAIRYKISGDDVTNRYFYRNPGEKFYQFEQRFFIKCFTLGYEITLVKYVCEYDSV